MANIPTRLKATRMAPWKTIDLKAGIGRRAAAERKAEIWHNVIRRIRLPERLRISATTQLCKREKTKRDENVKIT